MRLDMTIYINTRIWESPNFNRLRQSFCEPIIGWGQRGWRDITCIYRSFVSKKCQELKMKFCEENGTISFHTVPYMVRYENHNRNSMVISLVCLLPTHCKSINLSVVVLWLCSIASPIIFFFCVCEGLFVVKYSSANIACEIKSSNADQKLHSFAKYLALI